MPHGLDAIAIAALRDYVASPGRASPSTPHSLTPAAARALGRPLRLDEPEEGEDGPPPPAGQYRNPMLAGYYPDPAVLRVGRDYYLVNSTFTHSPACRSSTAATWSSWTPDRQRHRPARPCSTSPASAVSRGIFAPA